MNSSGGKKTFPESGRDRDLLLEEMKNRKANDYKWQEGKNFAYVYYPGEEILSLVKLISTSFSHTYIL